MNLRDEFHFVRVRGSARAWRAAVYASLFGALLVACGGGGGDGGSTGGSGPGSGTLAGAWYYDGAGTAQRFDLATAAETSVALNPKSNEQVGYGGGRFTEVEEDTSVSPFELTVNLRRSTSPYLEKTGQLPVFSVQGGSVRGPVQPSPDGALYAVHISEHAGLGEPFFDYLYVLDAALAIPLRVQGRPRRRAVQRRSRCRCDAGAHWAGRARLARLGSRDAVGLAGRSQHRVHTRRCDLADRRGRHRPVPAHAASGQSGLARMEPRRQSARRDLRRMRAGRGRTAAARCGGDLGQRKRPEHRQCSDGDAQQRRTGAHLRAADLAAAVIDAPRDFRRTIMSMPVFAVRNDIE
jgi:hypothetical protein